MQSLLKLCIALGINNKAPALACEAIGKILSNNSEAIINKAREAFIANENP